MSTSAIKMLELQRQKYQSLADRARAKGATGAARAGQAAADATQVAIDWYKEQADLAERLKQGGAC